MSADKEYFADEAFLRLCYRAETMHDLVRASGTTRQSVHSRLKRLKEGGVPLPELPKHDWTRLRALAQKLAQERAQRARARRKAAR